jgi:hypothetical protein
MKPTRKPVPAKRRPGRPVSTGRGVSVTIYIARPVYDTLAAIAADNRGLVSGVIRNAIAAYLEL